MTLLIVSTVGRAGGGGSATNRRVGWELVLPLHTKRWGGFCHDEGGGGGGTQKVLGVVLKF